MHFKKFQQHYSQWFRSFFALAFAITVCSQLNGQNTTSISQINKYIRPSEHFFSQIELKLLYGNGIRSLNIDNLDANSRNYYEKQIKGKDLSLEISTHVYKSLFVSFYYSSFATPAIETSVQIRAPQGGFYTFSNETISINRTGASLNLSHHFSQKSNARMHVSFGFLVANTVNAMDTKGAGEPFYVKMKGQSKTLPFMTAGLSTSIAVPNLNLHIRCTQHFGRQNQIESDDLAFKRENTELNLISLKQLSLQIGFSWIFVSKIPH